MDYIKLFVVFYTPRDYKRFYFGCMDVRRAVRSTGSSATTPPYPSYKDQHNCSFSVKGHHIFIPKDSLSYT